MALIKITLIICTKDRPKDLHTLLSSVACQGRSADRIIVIDGSDTPVRHVLDGFPQLPLEYQAQRPPSLPKQRNVGIGMLGTDPSWVGFLDDDLVLVEDAFAEFEHFVAKQTSVAGKPLGGVGLTINNEGLMAFSRWRNFMLLDKAPGGVFTRSGCPAAIRSFAPDMDLEWLYGGATFWHTDVLRDFAYDEWFEGTGYYEDIDFSFRAATRYRLALNTRSRCFHYHHPVRQERLVALGTWQLAGWWYFVRKVGAFPLPYVFWSMLGLTLNNLGMGLLRPANGRLRRGWGNLKGLGLILTGRALQSRKFSK